MQKKIFFLPLVFFIIFLLSTELVIAQPIFTVDPIVKAPATMFTGSTVNVKYRITNNLSRAFFDNGVVDLSDSIIQDTSSGCANPFNLDGHTSCILNLTIKPTVPGIVSANPKICNTLSSQTYCNIPEKVSDRINISVIDNPIANTTINVVSEMKLDPNKAGQSYTITNNGDNIWQNPGVGLAKNLNGVIMSNTCSSSIDPGNNCQVTFDTENATLGDTTSLNITGDNLITVSPTVIVNGGVRVYADNDESNKHLAYRAIAVENLSDETISINSLESSFPNNIKICEYDDNECVLKSTCKKNDGTVLLPSQSCSVWIRALTTADGIQSTNGVITVGYKKPSTSTTIETQTVSVNHNIYLYAGGKFSIAGSGNASKITKYNGTQWEALTSDIIGPSSGDEIRALEDDKYGDLIAGGDFLKIGSLTVNNIARWNGDSWNRMGYGVGNHVNALTKDNNNDHRSSRLKSRPN